MKKNYFITLLLTLCFSTISFGQSALITGYVDAPCSGATPRTVEIYVDGTIDFTGWNLVRQSNGGGYTSNIDLSSLGSITDAFAYVTNNTTNLSNEFGITSNVISNSGINSNGDDAFQLTDNSSSIIDRFGEDGVDGSGTAWEHVDTYYKRNDGSTANAGSFDVNNWTFGTQNLLDGQGTCNGQPALSTLVPFGTFMTTAPTNPTVTIAGSVATLDYFENNGPSAEGNFTVSGINLTTDITVTAPTNFEVSLTSGSGFANSVNVSQSAGTASATTVYVRLVSGLTSNTYNGDVTVSSTGATDKTLAVTGTVSPDDPQFTVTAFLDDLNYIISVGGPSAEDDFSVSGLFLTNDLVITAPTNFEVSLTSGSGFGSSVNITPSSGTVASTKVYVRLAAGLSAGNYTGDITVSSTGVTSQTIALIGNVFGATTDSMVITGIYDGPLSGGTPKGVELYVLKDIADLSLFGVSSVSNGNGSTAGNVEFTFPSGSATAGTFIYVATETTNFTTFFGMAPTYTTGVVSINGNDSIELYESGQIIDVFGDVDTDGTGEVWEYLDGWAYRNANTGPEGTTFTPTNWTYSGANALDGESDNASAATPFPIGTYTNATASLNDNSIQGFSAYPNPVTNKSFTVKTSNSSNKEVAIFNVLGKKVFYTTFSGLQKTVNVTTLNSGIYILKVIEDGKSSTKKLVIK